MNIGMIIGIILMALGAVLIWGMFSSKKFWINFWAQQSSATFTIFAFAAIIFGFFVTICAWAYVPYNPDAVNTKYQEKCQVCGRTFENISSDARSIRMTNMCNLCYKNFKTAQDMLGN